MNCENHFLHPFKIFQEFYNAWVVPRPNLVYVVFCRWPAWWGFRNRIDENRNLYYGLWARGGVVVKELRYNRQVAGSITVGAIRIFL
jgi:hypothetical protein